ncbi:MAG: ATP-binding protein [Opitutaceae bacterium]
MASPSGPAPTCWIAPFPISGATLFATPVAPAAITLRAETDATAVRIIVEDAGPGVPPEALARLGEPLFRPDIARTREGGGAGLGLAIVKCCIEACGGTVEFANREPHGLRVTLSLPVTVA